MLKHLVHPTLPLTASRNRSTLPSKLSSLPPPTTHAHPSYSQSHFHLIAIITYLAQEYLSARYANIGTTRFTSISRWVALYAFVAAASITPIDIGELIVYSHISI